MSEPPSAANESERVIALKVLELRWLGALQGEFTPRLGSCWPTEAATAAMEITKVAQGLAGKLGLSGLRLSTPSSAARIWLRAGWQFWCYRLHTPVKDVTWSERENADVDPHDRLELFVPMLAAALEAGIPRSERHQFAGIDFRTAARTWITEVRRTGRLIGIFREGELAGYAAVTVADEELVLHDLGVAPAYLARGIAASLLACVNDVARDARLPRITTTLGHDDSRTRRALAAATRRHGWTCSGWLLSLPPRLV